MYLSSISKNDEILVKLISLTEQILIDYSIYSKNSEKDPKVIAQRMFSLHLLETNKYIKYIPPLMNSYIMYRNQISHNLLKEVSEEKLCDFCFDIYKAVKYFDKIGFLAQIDNELFDFIYDLAHLSNKHKKKK